MANTTKPFSLSLGGSSSQSKKTSFNLQKPTDTSTSTSTSTPPRNALPRRPHQLHHDDDSDDEPDSGGPVHEAVTGFDTLTGTAIPADGPHEKRDLVIPVTSTNNWRDRPGVNIRRGKKNLLPKEVQAIQEAARRGETAGDNVETERPSMEYGLSYAQRADADGPPAAAAAEKQDQEQQQQQQQQQEQVPRKPLTQDEIALNALIRESKGEVEPRSDLVIESAGHERDRYDETTSFKADVATRPEPASLEQYNAIPVEEFGAALLRGMGWKEGQAVGKGQYGSSSSASPAGGKPRVPERRPGFLGIGAKDSGKGGAEAELGAWGRSAMRKGARRSGKEGAEGNTEGVYMPVMMRNRKTGDFVTEEELALQKKEAARALQRDGEDWRERRDRNLERSGRDRERDSRRRRDERDEEDDRYERRRGSSRRDRSRSSGDRHSRRRRYDEDDDRYYRDRGSDRERRRYRDDDRHSSSASSRHGRDRDRDRDSDGSYRRRHGDRR
ncbi:DExH-box splicing factor binding site-domain-containing protein [Aspergillus ambiguus]|uniref:spliceosome ATPase-activating subunit SPP2 n=1 Tax=Aspergillus ambiguus TaxID=176160 RepID=UPI003CCE2C3F